MKNWKKQKGFSLLEMMVALAILMIVAGTMIAGMIRMTWSQGTIMNRTQLHSSVRNATEMMQQEIGQAGRVISQPGLKFTTSITVPSTSTSVVASPTLTTTATSGTSTDRLYVGEQIVVDVNSAYEETVTITAITAGTGITAAFTKSHTAPIPVLVLGGFVSGIVPPTGKSVFSGTGTTATPLTAGTSDGSGDQILKLYGDINGDGDMWYVIYTCNPNTSGTGTLKRYAVQDVNYGTAATLGSSGVVLLDTLYTDGTAIMNKCFTYFTTDTAVTINGGQVSQTFVTNVSVTLTVQTQNLDAKTRQPQRETKALLNVSPRNVFNAWELASAPSGYTRAQPMPRNILTGLTEGGTQNTPLLTATLQ